MNLERRRHLLSDEVNKEESGSQLDLLVSIPAVILMAVHFPSSTVGNL